MRAHGGGCQWRSTCASLFHLSPFFDIRNKLGPANFPRPSSTAHADPPQDHLLLEPP
ncbi:hypothetical protein CERSUDRAFT_82433 [Gelatoporia subvermispora B]|uniref:Uncharacterized protein n=1 Tax=Ceriporiopsis subvermispora (strain B) TaxID=914234 RepID=M2RI77_CERS8|nr:hypothetical protein CERSUDRAFT_82433 [Gelatoporia subvermispora B]